ncbi:aminodeoxychorismate synthase component I [Alteromonas pelagimontana]|uniref:aminodeoxychorismate synthase n=1 Tax=Alteromonas pelagimontana TaxID=1858656 RepID=A0A6M4MIJ0_9ALTE|nr:aminodeoxychorismate synthase component I [Alteromonas pelagimontana]
MYARFSKELKISVLPESSGMTLHTLFERIQLQPGSVLLDTANNRSSNSRFNIMLWEPVFLVTAEQGQTLLTDCLEQTTTILEEKPLAAVQRVTDTFFAGVNIEAQSHTYADFLPFLAGAAGLCGYDLGRYYESLPSHALADYACPDMAIGIYPRSLIEDTTTGIIYDCRLTNLSQIEVGNWGISPDSEIAPKTAPFSLTQPWQSNLSKGQYTDALHRIGKYLRAGDCYQVNMAQRFSAPYTGDEWQAYVYLSQQNQAPFSAFVRLAEACVMSISPERFLAVKESQVETKPIKGTRPRYSDPQLDKASAEALLSAEKDRAENLMIVDLLRNDLSKHCKAGSVKVPDLFKLESYAAVHHMVSTVLGELNERSTPLDLLTGAFPGGSITGAPKIRAMEIIDELEPHRRNVYCGSIFYLGFRQDMDSSILIRTLLAENGVLHCWAGGGIVLDSDADAEYQETLDKVSRILPALEKYGA